MIEEKEKNLSIWELKKIEYCNHVMFEGGLLRKVNIIMSSKKDGNNFYEWRILKNKSVGFELIGFSACLKSDSTPLLYELSTVKEGDKNFELVKILFPSIDKHQNIELSFEYFIKNYMKNERKQNLLYNITEFFYRKYSFPWNYTAYISDATKCVFKFILLKNMSLISEETNGWATAIPVTYDAYDDKNIIYYNERDVVKQQAYSGNLTYIEFYPSFFILLDASFAIFLSTIIYLSHESNLNNSSILFLIPVGLFFYLYLKTIFPNRNIVKRLA